MGFGVISSEERVSDPCLSCMSLSILFGLEKQFVGSK